MSEQAQAGQSTDPKTNDPGQTPDLDDQFDAERAKRTILAQREAEKRLKAQVAELTAKAQELDRLKEAEKTELQRAQERYEQEKAKREALERDLLRSHVALAKGLPAELASRLQGETEEELAADADALLALVTPQPAGPPRASATQGAPGSGPKDPLLEALKTKLGI